MNIQKFFTHLIPTALLGCVVSTSAHAYLTNPGNCTTDSVTINTIEKSPLDGQQMIYSSPAINATNCFGMVSGNDQGQLSNPSPNIGRLNDGLLNGQGGIISPMQFINSSQLLDIAKTGTKADPGWIYLGEVSGETGTAWNGYEKPLKIDDILSVSMKCTGAGDDKCTKGTWTLETKLDIVAEVQKVLGRDAFDHLAFVIKAGTRYAVYDFDFNIIAQPLIESGDFDFSTPYSFTGDWDTGDFPNPQGNNSQNFSHIALWARDPIPENPVPLPGTLALAGLGLVALSVSSRKSRA